MRIKYIDISYLMKKNVSSSVTTNLNLLVKHFIKHLNEPTTSVHSLEHMQFSLQCLNKILPYWTYSYYYLNKCGTQKHILYFTPFLYI